MKKRGILLLVTATMLLVETPVLATPVAASAPTLRANDKTHSSNVLVLPRKGVKPRRGGLFNTGLFRKKNACGCPKH